MLHSSHIFDHLPGNGDTVTLLRQTDWSRTCLGDPSTWPDALRLQVNVCFESQFPIAIWWGPDLIQLYNDFYRPILGSSKHPASFGGPARETWPEIWPTIGAMVDQVMNDGIAVRGEDMPLELLRNGYPELCHFTFSYSPIRDISGAVVGMFTAAVETSARVMAERRRAFQLNLADELRGLAATDDIIGTATRLIRQHLGVTRAYYAEIDDQAGCFHIPAQWTHGGELPALPGLPMHGSVASFSPYLLQSLRAARAVVAEDIAADPHLAGHAQAYQDLGMQSVVVIPLNRGGQLRANFNVGHSVPRRWSPGELEIIADVAERTWDAIERARAEEALRLSSRLKDEFLAMLAHELRNPLAPISAAADLLAAARLDEDKIHRTSAVIQRQVAHMTALVDDLLDISRVTRGLITLEQREIDVHDVIADAEEQARPLMEKRQHALRCVYRAGKAYVRGDRKRLVQVLANLLNNAAKYTPPGGAIDMRVEVRERDVAISVSDNGIGMAHELVGRVFDLFAQGERDADRTQGGLGIGLALVRNLVELHGGSVGAHSAGAGQGSRFTVTLPRIEPAAAPAGSAGSATGFAPAAGGLKVLVVDDNADAAAMLSMLVESAGHDVVVELSSLRALDNVETIRPDICLLDIGLPELDGNALARRLRAMPRLPPPVLVAVTGYGQQSDRDKAFAAGFDHFFTKPVDISRLMALLTEVHTAGPAARGGPVR